MCDTSPPLTPSTDATSMVAMDAFQIDCGTHTMTVPAPTVTELAHWRALASCDAAIVEELGPECDVCDDLGVVYGASGAGGRPVVICHNCDAYDRNEQAASDAAAEMWEDK